MFCYRNKQSLRLCEWGQHRTGVSLGRPRCCFRLNRSAKAFEQVMGGHRRQWRLEQTDKLQPCWIFQDGRYHWEGTVTGPELAEMNPQQGPIQHPDGLTPELEQLLPGNVPAGWALSMQFL